MDPLAWSALLLLLGLLLVMVEVFIPSGGVLGFLSITSLVAGVILAFYHRGAEVGFLFLTVTAVALPVTLMMAFRWWPKTPMGRRILLDVPKSEEVLPDSPQRRWLRQMVGRVGVAKSLMLPSGAIEVDGHTIDALTEGTPIEPGQRVRVIAVSGNRVVVRVADDAAPAETDDVLSRPIDFLGLESLDDPLA
ncbi:MAG TPA: NfeD family protein [Pirellulales bacterium]|jgi:membrane-bound ClpP family serine protease|nr:NfeD family protein [Pirellulales bacterium]